MDFIITHMDWIAAVVSLLSVKLYGDKRVTAAAWIGASAIVPWTILSINNALWGMALANLVFAGMHVRNLITNRKH